MLELLGTACVGWTLFELSGLLHAARDRSACARGHAQARSAHAAGDHAGTHTGTHAGPHVGDRRASPPRFSQRRERPRRASPRRPGRARRFDAWDDQGNRIVVEDLGAR